MSDDKNKKDQTSSDGTGTDSGTSGSTDNATKLGFGELFGYIDERIKSAMGGGAGSGKDSGTAGKGGDGAPGSGDPQSVADQVRRELAKLSGEKEAADKDAARDVTIAELKEQVAKISEEKPAENFSKLTQLMWGKRSKS